MKNRERSGSTRVRSALRLRRRHFGVLLCWSLALSLAQLTGDGEAFANGDAASSQADTGSNDDSGHGDTGANDDRHSVGPHGDNIGEGHGDDGESIQGQSEVPEDTDQEKVREAVDQGRVLPLKEVLARIDTVKYGTVIAVDLQRDKGKNIYRLKTRDGLGVIYELRINAHTGKFVNIFGF